MSVLSAYPEAGAALPAHIAVYFARPLGLGLRFPSRPYFFEPVTYPFAKPKSFVSKVDDQGNLQTKISFKRLADSLGPPFSEMVGEKKVKPEHLTPARVRECTERWVDVQTGFTSAPGVELVQKKLAEYDELAGEPAQPVGTSAPPPTWISALSFPVNKREDPYFDRTLASAEVVKESQGASKTLVFLHIEGWSEGDVELFDDISASLPPSIAVELWIDGHHDRQSLAVLKVYLEVIKSLAKRGRKVLLYSSSILGACTKSIGVAGFVAGTGGNEPRSSTDEPATGGGNARYYVPLTSTLERTQPCRLFFTRHPEEFCKGSACQTLLGKRPSSREEFDDFFGNFYQPESKAHFLEVRSAELRSLSTKTNREYAKELRDRHQRARLAAFDQDFRQLPTHLLTWASLVEGLS